jgi:hypothetical protein
MFTYVLLGSFSNTLVFKEIVFIVSNVLKMYDVNINYGFAIIKGSQ